MSALIIAIENERHGRTLTQEEKEHINERIGPSVDRNAGEQGTDADRDSSVEREHDLWIH
jgi:hypothetical protein